MSVISSLRRQLEALNTTEENHLPQETNCLEGMWKIRQEAEEKIKVLKKQAQQQANYHMLLQVIGNIISSLHSAQTTSRHYSPGFFHIYQWQPLVLAQFHNPLNQQCGPFQLFPSQWLPFLHISTCHSLHHLRIQSQHGISTSQRNSNILFMSSHLHLVKVTHICRAVQREGSELRILPWTQSTPPDRDKNS